jgi:histidyl-tRNA synthetase
MRLGVKEYVKFDPNIMRGLLYYTGTVFEAFETSGSSSAPSWAADATTTCSQTWAGLRFRGPALRWVMW